MGSCGEYKMNTRRLLASYLTETLCFVLVLVGDCHSVRCLMAAPWRAEATGLPAKAGAEATGLLRCCVCVLSSAGSLMPRWS